MTAISPTLWKTISLNAVSKVDISSMLRLCYTLLLYVLLLTTHRFLALGGAIGTGLFVGSGQILALVGPAPLFMAYICMMFVVWIVMNNLAEMVTYLPLKGISIPYFVSRFVEPSLAFADGWNYWVDVLFLRHYVSYMLRLA